MLKAIQRDHAKLLAKHDRRIDTALVMLGETATRRAAVRHQYQDRTGRLTRSSRYSVRGKKRVRIFNTASYAYAVEHGTRAHVIKPRKRKSLRFVVGGRVVFARSVQHPGTRATNFLGNAVQFAHQKVGKWLRN